MTSRRVGPYEVVRELGRGGMGVVLEVRHPDVPRPLALKLLLGLEADDEALARFAREAQLLARVQHPNVVRVHTVGRAPEGAYIVSELVEGEPLVARCRRGPLEPRQAAALVRDLALAVAALHAAGVLHRDLKPHNVIVRPDGAPVLLDFGVARDLASRERLTRTGAMLGTPAYMAPEQADGTSPAALDERVDVYGLGAVLFEALAGRPPFDEASGPMAVLKHVMLDEPRWPTADRPDLPPRLEAVLRVAMAKDREVRYARARDLADDLDRWLQGERPLVSREPPRRWAVPALVAGALVLLLCGVAASVPRGPWPPSGTPVAGQPPPRPGPPATASPAPSSSSPERAPAVLFTPAERELVHSAACALDLDPAAAGAHGPVVAALRSSPDPVVALFDLGATPPRELERLDLAPGAAPRALAPLSGGDLVIAMADGSLARREGRGRALRTIRRGAGAPTALAAATAPGAGPRIALAHAMQQEVHVVLPAGEERLPGHRCDVVSALAFSPDATLLAVGGASPFGSGRPCAVWLWSIEPVKLVASVDLPVGATSLAFVGDVLLVGMVNGYLGRFSVPELEERGLAFASSEVRMEIAGPTNGARLAHSSDVNGIVFAGERLYTASTGRNKSGQERDPRWNELRAWRLIAGEGRAEEVLLGRGQKVLRSARPYLSLSVAGPWLLAPTAAGAVEVWPIE